MKKIIFLVALLSQFLLSNCIIFADDVIVVDEDEYKDMVKMVAIEWAQVMEPEYDLQVADVCEVNCIYGKENVTYAVNFIEGVTSYGYALVELVDGEPVVTEARIVPGEEGIRTKIAEVAYNKYDGEEVDVSKEIISTAPLQYAVKIEEGDREIFIDELGNEYNDISVESNERYDNAGELFIKNTVFMD